MRQWLMGNAHEKILDAAGYVTRSNDEDGAAFAMRLAMEDRLEEIKKSEIEKKLTGEPVSFFVFFAVLSVVS